MKPPAARRPMIACGSVSAELRRSTGPPETTQSAKTRIRRSLGRTSASEVEGHHRPTAGQIRRLVERFADAAEELGFDRHGKGRRQGHVPGSVDGLRGWKP